MTISEKNISQGSPGVPSRPPLDWKKPCFHDEEALFQELERVFDICYGCRRCLALCNAFPTLIELVDESTTMELDGVAKQDYWKVVDHCYLCDLCYATKCPYIPPHERNVDFPQLMLRAKAFRFGKRGAAFRDRLLASPDRIGRLAAVPVVGRMINVAGKSHTLRSMLHLHPEAALPDYHRNSFRKRHRDLVSSASAFQSSGTGVVLFATCWGNYNEPDLGEDLCAVFEHNAIPVALAEKEHCCGMLRLELGDLDAVEMAKNDNIPVLAEWVDSGWGIVVPVPGCVQMFKQWLPLMFPDDPQVEKVRNAVFDPIEYLMLRKKEGQLKTDFKHALGVVSYHLPCHLRARSIGEKTRDILSLIPGTHVEVIAGCSGRDGSYAVKSEHYKASMELARPVVDRIRQVIPDHYSSGCPMAGVQIENSLADGSRAEHPLALLRRAYGI